MHTRFLRQVAQYFHGKSGGLQDYCFVLPNHRSCKFFERELEMTGNGVFLMPEIMTITDFVSSLTDAATVKPVEALFLLYKCYSSITGNEDYPFDKFIYWGNVVISDFNDVDMNLVDSNRIFKNLKEHREIQANYFDADLQQIVARYFNLSPEGLAANSEEFWRNYNVDSEDQESVKAEYLRLWQSLNVLYENYHKALEQRGLCTMGKKYRDAVDVVKNGQGHVNQTMVFVGFNMLSTSELAIFKRLKQQGRALFFWDVAARAFNDDKGVNNGANYVKFFRREFPEPHDFIPDVVDSFPVIDVVGVPSNVGQAKYCYHLFENLIKDGTVNGKDAINTALVLPDEGLMVPMLNSLSPSIEKKNVTMGYPLIDSDMASLMRVVAKMHRQARRGDDGEWTYYRSDVKVTLSHPIVRNYFGAEALELLRVIAEKNLFAVPQQLFANTKLELLFHTIDNVDDSASVIEFLRGFITFINSVIDVMVSPPSSDVANETEIATPTMTLQEAFCRQYVDLIEQLIEMLTRYELPPCEATLFFLIDKLAASFSVPFEGEPLQGLQIMGMLETRCLDFENIIILSANEGTLPGKVKSNSFISDFLRYNYGMSTMAQQDAMYNYYFYRLIGRAKRLIMVYDTSDQAMGAGEVSRYVPQLEMVYDCHVNRLMFSTKSVTAKPLEIMMPKRGDSLKKLNEFRCGYGNRALSASTIKEYVNCGLMFYFHTIEKLRASDIDGDFMDAVTFGDIVHNALQQLYYPDCDGKPREGDYKVTCRDIRLFKKNKLANVVQNLVNEKYMHNSSISKLVGEASIVSVAITKFANAALDHDIELLQNIDNNYFTVIECESRHNITMKYGGVDFNFTYIADRIDRLSSGQLRIVDYKTGKDATSFKSVDELFADNDTTHRGILQLMLYCNAYAQENGLDEPIMPIIYTLRDMNNAGVLFNGEQLQDYRLCNDDFKLKMDQVIKSMFDQDGAFEQTANNDPSTTPCRFCKYADFCRR